jgi:4-aminobutyrate aminotransferase-like enzyme
MKQKHKSTSPGSKRGSNGALATAAKVSLRQIEQETLAEGREWTRRRLQQRLQQLADKHGEISPLEPKKD